jgi:cell division septal protein FtsQ
LRCVNSVNKTDVVTLLDSFGNFTNLCTTEEHKLFLCPGLGEKKVKRLYQAFHEPFIRKKQVVSSSNYKSNTSAIQITNNDSNVIPINIEEKTNNLIESSIEKDVLNNYKNDIGISNNEKKI